MPNYTIQDLAWMKGVPVPVREALFSLEQQLTAAQAREAELVAHVERLREALEYSLQAWKYDGVSDEHGSIFAKADSVCDATPAQSLARLRNEVLEECKHNNVVRQYTGDGTPVDFCLDCGRNEVVGCAPDQADMKEPE